MHVPEWQLRICRLLRHADVAVEFVCLGVGWPGTELKPIIVDEPNSSSARAVVE